MDSHEGSCFKLYLVEFNFAVKENGDKMPGSVLKPNAF